MALTNAPKELAVKRLLEARMRDRDRMRSWTWRTQRDRADGSLTPAHTGSHGDCVPEIVPPGVLSSFISPHRQDEDGHPQRSNGGHWSQGYSHTQAQSHRDTVPFQGW